MTPFSPSSAPPIGMRTCSLPASETAGAPFDVAVLQALVGAGLEVAELSFNRPAAGVAHDDEALARSLRQARERLGLTFTAHAPDRFQLSNPDRDELKQTLADVVPVVTGAAACGARALVIHACPGTPMAPGGETAAQDALNHALATLAPTCEKEGVRLAVETMVPGRLTSTIEPLIAAVDAVGSPWVGICVDTNHLNLSQDVNAAIRLAGPRIAELHINDNHFEQEEHLLPYAGAIDWDALIRTLADVGCAAPLVMEPGGQYADAPDLVERVGRTATRLREAWALVA